MSSIYLNIKNFILNYSKKKKIPEDELQRWTLKKSLRLFAINSVDGCLVLLTIMSQLTLRVHICNNIITLIRSSKPIPAIKVVQIRDMHQLIHCDK